MDFRCSGRDQLFGGVVYLIICLGPSQTHARLWERALGMALGVAYTLWTILRSSKMKPSHWLQIGSTIQFLVLGMLMMLGRPEDDPILKVIAILCGSEEHGARCHLRKPTLDLPLLLQLPDSW